MRIWQRRLRGRLPCRKRQNRADNEEQVSRGAAIVGRRTSIGLAILAVAGILNRRLTGGFRGILPVGSSRVQSHLSRIVWERERSVIVWIPLAIGVLAALWVGAQICSRTRHWIQASHVPPSKCIEPTASGSINRHGVGRRSCLARWAEVERDCVKGSRSRPRVERLAILVCVVLAGLTALSGCAKPTVPATPVEQAPEQAFWARIRWGWASLRRQDGHAQVPSGSLTSIRVRRDAGA